MAVTDRPTLPERRNILFIMANQLRAQAHQRARELLVST
jgi:hypothetical protein